MERILDQAVRQAEVNALITKAEEQAMMAQGQDDDDAPFVLPARNWQLDVRCVCVRACMSAGE